MPITSASDLNSCYIICQALGANCQGVYVSYPSGSLRCVALTTIGGLVPETVESYSLERFTATQMPPTTGPPLTPPPFRLDPASQDGYQLLFEGDTGMHDGLPLTFSSLALQSQVWGCFGILTCSLYMGITGVSSSALAWPWHVLSHLVTPCHTLSLLQRAFLLDSAAHPSPRTPDCQHVFQQLYGQPPLCGSSPPRYLSALRVFPAQQHGLAHLHLQLQLQLHQSSSWHYHHSCPPCL
jgi:hypothetical protein